MRDLINYAAMVGFDEDTISQLIKEGYCLDEIEQILYEVEFYYKLECGECETEI